MLGDDGNDLLYGGGGSDQLDGGYGADQIHGGPGHDLILGGPGVDVLRGDDGIDRIFGGQHGDDIYGGNHGDILIGGVGDDDLFGESGEDLLRGGPGNDVLTGGPGDDHLYGGSGNDRLLGGGRADFLVPGPDVDEVRGEAADDVILILDPCEVKPGEILDGGTGFDVINSPVSRTQLQSLGATLISIEEVRETPLTSSSKVCAKESSALKRAELSGMVVDVQTVWRTANGTEYPNDGQYHTGAYPFEKATFFVDAVYATQNGDDPGEIVVLYQPGGEVSVPNNRSLEATTCCVPRWRRGQRLRLALREVKNSLGGFAGYEVETHHAYEEVNLDLFLTLADNAPVPGNLTPEFLESLRAVCDYGLDLFEDAAHAVHWIRLHSVMSFSEDEVEFSDLSRWDQSFPHGDGTVARPVFRADLTTLFPEGWAEFDPALCADPGDAANYYEHIPDMMNLWTDGGFNPSGYGLLAPGGPNNPLSLAPCKAMDVNGPATDGINCVAMDGWNDVPNGAQMQEKLDDIAPDLFALTITLADASDPFEYNVRRLIEAGILFRGHAPYFGVCPAAPLPPGEAVFGIFFGRLVSHETSHAVGLPHSFCPDEVSYEGAVYVSSPVISNAPSFLEQIKLAILYPAWSSGAVWPENHYLE